MSEETFQGKVKWFSSKSGYGFITITETPDSVDKLSQEDIFVHHTGIITSNNVYKFLVQDEMVNLKVMTLDSEKHKYQAHDVTPVQDKLRCEIIAERRKNQKTRRPRQQTQYRNKQTQTSNDTSEDSKEFSMNSSEFPGLESNPKDIVEESTEVVEESTEVVEESTEKVEEPTEEVSED